MLKDIAQPDQREGPIARKLEKQTAKLPSDLFLWGALGAMGLSLYMQTQRSNRSPSSVFIGQWVPTLLMFGLYNKIVKVAGSDRFDQPNAGSFPHQMLPGEQPSEAQKQNPPKQENPQAPKPQSQRHQPQQTP